MKKGKKFTVAGSGKDPSTTLSYGILLKYLTTATSRKYEWNLLVEEHHFGPPIMHNHYIDWACGKNIVERDRKYVPFIIKNVKPEFFFTLGDPQFIRNIRAFIPKTVPWIHWLPLDHHDDDVVMRNKYIFDSIDVCVPMAKHTYDMCKRNKIKTYPYIYPFINTKEFSPITESKEPQLYKDLQLLKKDLKIENKKVLLWVGRPGWRKNLEMLLGAYEKLLHERKRDDIHLYLHTDVTDVSKTFNIGKMIHAIGLNHTDFTITKGMELGVGSPTFYLRGLYNVADIYVTTHGGEGFGMPIAEAMAAKTPFVATNTTTTEELAGENSERGLKAKIAENHYDRGVLRPYVDIDDFCDKVEYLLDHNEERRKMGEKGRDWVVKNCSINVIKKKFLKLFDDLIVNKVEIGGVIDERT